ncbi:hypothetical protein DSO57_1013021 [Entomophthora muscae]|uniref:Uncharacterized protein n=1 Tax=Entomophthora muscae TaxID=34485 RepID=A0ACC2RKP4_9FUNG|nr:hypothetical protein DSO57_1013021 [Entomophthora muscae]
MVTLQLSAPNYLEISETIPQFPCYPFRPLPQTFGARFPLLCTFLTCNELDLYSPGLDLCTPFVEEAFEPPILQLEDEVSGTQQASEVLECVLTRTPWLLVDMVLMGLNAYFPQLSPVFSLWSPFRAAVPVIHWTASWWFVSPGWEPNLVGLAPPSLTDLMPCPLSTLPAWQDPVFPCKEQDPSMAKILVCDPGWELVDP